MSLDLLHATHTVFPSDDGCAHVGEHLTAGIFIPRRDTGPAAPISFPL